MSEDKAPDFGASSIYGIQKVLARDPFEGLSFEDRQLARDMEKLTLKKEDEKCPRGLT